MKISMMNSIDRGLKIRYSGMKDHPTWSIIISLARSSNESPHSPSLIPLKALSVWSARKAFLATAAFWKV